MRFKILFLVFLGYFRLDLSFSEEVEFKSDLSHDGPKAVKLDSFYDPKFDYEHFPGRVTDRDLAGNVFRIQTPNLNVKFFRAGDYLEFTLEGVSTEEATPCGAYVRSVEEEYFVIFIKDLYPCWPKGEYFRRGTMLNFSSDVLAKRVQDAALFRVTLLKRRQDFLTQLNEINHFLWSYDQKKAIVISEFDERIEKIKLERQKAIDELLSNKKDQTHLQAELMGSLDSTDRDLEFYRIERPELELDRWNTDRDLGLPVEVRPKL